MLGGVATFWRSAPKVRGSVRGALGDNALHDLRARGCERFEKLIASTQAATQTHFLEW